MDEGDLTRGVVARYAATDGSLGQSSAERVLPARRELWRLVEALAPRALAAALRARLAPSDQSGRGGVRELRAALADWLDPPPTCAHCGRPFDPATSTGPARLQCPSRPRPRPWTPGRGRPPLPVPCAARRGTRARTGHDAHPTVARCGTLALFTPLHLDPSCAAAQKMLRHGGALAYDVVVDRDARILLAVTQAIVGDHLVQTRAARTNEMRAPEKVVFHIDHDSTRLIAAARRALDRALETAVRENGRLILATQVRYFAPKHGVTRADLVQGGAMGCRRALLDYDANYRPPGKKQGVRFSTYGINWIHQGIGEVFAERDLVSVPEWCVDLRADVEALGLSPGILLAGVMAAVEARADEARCLLAAEDLALTIVAHHHQHATGSDDRERDAEDQHHGGELAEIGEDDVVVVEVAHASYGSTSRALADAARRKAARAKNPPTDERSAEQVAEAVARVLGLEAGAGKPCTGAALLTALRYGHAPTTVPVSAGGERDGDDAGADLSYGAGGAGGGGDHSRRLPATDAGDEEDAALEEEHDRRRHAATLAALASLREADPEAAEVVRRRHGLDGVGDGETLEDLAARPLLSTGRTLCRESARKAYKRGVAHLRAHAGASLPAGLFAGPPVDPGADDDGSAARRPHGPFRPRRPARVVAHVSPQRPRDDHAPGPEGPEAWVSAAMSF